MDETVYLPGPTICGLHGMFERDFGCPDTQHPYARVTPSRVGTALLPFHCPSCEGVIDFTDKTQREHYHDTRVVSGKQRDNYWCPSCGTRFFLNLRGKPLAGEVGADGAAESAVECIGSGEHGMLDFKRYLKRSKKRSLTNYVLGCDVAGAA